MELQSPAEFPRCADLPSITVVVPSLNQGEYLERTLKSLLDQGYPGLEIIVVDGGSSDGTIDVLKRYAGRLTWWCSEPDGGQTQAINKGFRISSGGIMAWLNSDDQLLPGTLFRVAQWFGEHPETDALYGQRIMVDALDREVGRWILPPHADHLLDWIDVVPQETLFWRRSLWDKTGGALDSSFSFAMDWDLLLRFRVAGAKIVRLPFFMGLFRVHPAQKSQAQIDSVGCAEMGRLRLRRLGFSPGKYRVILQTLPYRFKVRGLELMWRAGLIRYH